MTSFFGIDLESALPPLAPVLSKAAAQKKIFDFLVPKPSPFPLIRLGGQSDGAYLVPDCLHLIDACFSPGVANRKDFEDALYFRNGIRSHMCDFSSDLDSFGTDLLPGQSFKKLWLDVDGQNSISIEDWVLQLERDSDSLMLQMDIEGAEYRNILSTPESILSRFKLCIIELHSLADIDNQSILFSVFLPFFDKLSRFFACVHCHPNNCSSDFNVPLLNERFPRVLEITLVSHSLLRDSSGSGQNTFYPLIPHPLDVVNVSHQPPLFLSGGWRAFCRDPESSLQVESLKQYQLLAYYQNPENFTRVDSANKSIKWLAAWSHNPGTLSMTPSSEVCALAEMVDISTGKVFVCSTAHESRPAHAGTLSIEQSQPFFFHTLFGAFQGICLDLCEVHDGSLFVEIVNRTDSCQDRAEMLFLYLSEERPDLSEPPPLEDVFRIRVSDEFLSVHGLPFVVYCPPARARYVYLFSPLITSLHFASLRILAQN